MAVPLTFDYIDTRILLRVWSLRRNTTLIKDICSLFTETSREGIIKALEASELGDGKKTAYWLHRIKGSALNVGANRFANLVDQLENQASHDLNDFQSQMEWQKGRLEKSYKNTVQEIEILIQDLESKEN